MSIVRMPSRLFWTNKGGIQLFLQVQYSHNSKINKNLKKMFFSVNYVCPQDFNPSDFYIETLAIQPNSREESIARASVRFESKYFFEFGIFCWSSENLRCLQREHVSNDRAELDRVNWEQQRLVSGEEHSERKVNKDFSFPVLLNWLFDCFLKIRIDFQITIKMALVA